jgi:DMSO reductase anchor subunit
VASVAAILHLAHPDRAYDALINLQHAWLSREILGATLYGAAVGVTFLAKGTKRQLFWPLFSVSRWWRCRG